MDLLSILKRFKDKRILVIGDLVLDQYIWGKVTRISPEAPVPVVDVTGDTFNLGGAANVANNIVSLGGKATVMGVAGKDRAAETMEELLRERKIDFLAVEDSRPTTIKTRVIAHSQQVVRFDQENRDYLRGRVLKSLLGNIQDVVGEYDAVIISDYKKGVVTGEVIGTVVKAAGEKFVSVDPKVGHFHLYKGVSLITPNKAEASQGSGIDIVDEATLIKAARKLISKLGLSSLLITRGEEGMSLFYNGTAVHIPALARKVYDVTGAGDTVIAAFTLARASGADLDASAVIANHASGIVVGEVGTACATPERVRQSIRASRLRLEKVKI